MTIFINIYFHFNSQIHFVEVKDEFRVVYLLKYVKTCAHQDIYDYGTRPSCFEMLYLQLQLLGQTMMDTK